MSKTAFQAVLDIIEERQFHAPASYRDRYFTMLTDGKVDEMAAKFRDLEERANAPVMVQLDPDKVHDNWLLAFGGCVRDGKDIEVTVTTDHVHASQMRGDALDDAECYVALRNNLPLVIAALEELLALRLEKRAARPAGPSGPTTAEDK